MRSCSEASVVLAGSDLQQDPGQVTGTQFSCSGLRGSNQGTFPHGNGSEVAEEGELGLS